MRRATKSPTALKISRYTQPRLSVLPYVVLQTAMFEQLELKTKERELWMDATSSFLLEKTEISKSLIIEFEKQKKRLRARVLDGKSRGRDVASSLKSKLSALNDTLFGIEEQVVEVQLQFNGDYESISDDLSSKRKSTFATFFTQVIPHLVCTISVLTLYFRYVIR